MPEAAITRAAVSAPDIPEDAGYWLYFAYAALTRHVAHRDSANVPKKSKILSPVILFLILKSSSPLPLQSDIAAFLTRNPKSGNHSHARSRIRSRHPPFTVRGSAQCEFPGNAACAFFFPRDQSPH